MTAFSEPSRARTACFSLIVIATCLLVVMMAQAPRATASHYHTDCVGHGFVSGSSTSDNSFHSRVEAGCGNIGRKTCKLFTTFGVEFKHEWVANGVNAGCNAWSNYEYGEWASTAMTDYNNVFGGHHHQLPHN